MTRARLVRSLGALVLALAGAGCGKNSSGAGEVAGGAGGVAGDAAPPCYTGCDNKGAAGQPIVVLACGQAPMRIAVDSSSLYWTTTGQTPGSLGGPNLGGAVVKVSLAGGAPVTLASGLDQPVGIAVDTANVYWTNEGDGTVMSVPLGGGVPTTLAAGRTSPGSIAVDATDAYWLDGNAALVRAPLQGGPATVLATTGQGDIPYLGNLALDATGIYWTEPNDHPAVYGLPLAGGTPTTIATASYAAFPEGIALDDTNVYWIDHAEGPVMKAPRAGGPAVTLAAGEIGGVGLAVDSTYVYWTIDYAPGGVARVAKAGGTPEYLDPDSDFGGALALVVDATNMYWAGGDGCLRTMAKP